jgi:hypothetical protein
MDPTVVGDWNQPNHVQRSAHDVKEWLMVDGWMFTVVRH